MKFLNQLKNTKLLSLAVILLTITAFTSCDKDNDDDNEPAIASVRVVNTVQGSASQDLYLDDVKLNSSAVAYAENSEYIKTSAGNRKGAFKSSGSSTVNTSFDLSLKAGKYYSVYFASDASSSTNYVVEDDMVAPAANKAKVRFVHLSSAAANKVDLAISAGTKIVTDLAYKAASAYSEVDANTTFLLYASGSSTVGLNLPTTVKAGKIYTIYVTGSTTATITYRVVAQN